MIRTLTAALAAVAFGTGAHADSVAQANKAAVLAVFEAFETGDLATLERSFATDGVIMVGFQTRERGGPYTAFRDAAPFPGSLTEVEVEVETIFAEGDHVAIQSVICGNHAAPILGFAPTGKRLCGRYTNLYRLEDGVIVHNTVGVYRDQLREQLEANAAE